MSESFVVIHVTKRTLPRASVVADLVKLDEIFSRRVLSMIEVNCFLAPVNYADNFFYSLFCELEILAEKPRLNRAEINAHLNLEIGVTAHTASGSQAA